MSSTIKATTGLDFQTNNTTALSIDASQNVTFAGTITGDGSGLSGLYTDADALSLLNASVGVCRAWVNFNGTGTVAIRAAFNVSSITDNGVGYFTVNLTTAMPDASYSVSGFARSDATNAAWVSGRSATAQTESSLSLGVTAWNGSSISSADLPQVSVSIFR